MLLVTIAAQAQHSTARLWNEATLKAIKGDFVRPPVQARNLFHLSVAMYDAWAVYNESGDTYFLGKTVNGFYFPFTGTARPAGKVAAQEEAISFAAYRLIRHRFERSPGQEETFQYLDALMDSLGYDRRNTSIHYKKGPAELGNYIASQIIEYGLQDGSNEAGNFQNQYYQPSNAPLVMALSGNPGSPDLNRWQPLSLQQIIDQSGNPIAGNVQRCLNPEWGQVLPFSLSEDEALIYQRQGFDYKVYLDPGPPPMLDTAATGGLSDEYKWGHELVAVWASHLDPSDGVLWDISPASIGNIQELPTSVPDYRNFYDLTGGGDNGLGWSLNPVTGQPYAPQIVPRGDYARVLAEFWADGPDSETPPGHWFSILNYVNDQPGLVKKLRGQGPLCTNLEWDIKCYFALGGALHDAAIAAWGIKGWYDSSRPVTAIRGMAELGQCSNPNLPNYHPGGLTLIPGFVELIEQGDSLQGDDDQYVGEIKLYTWKGPGSVKDPASDMAGVGWVRALDWYPYQRPTFVTPPFQGFISGHSTYSRTAAEVLTAITGSPFFPGGMGEFHCRKNEFLVFEEGPSVDLTLQWATYRDAADQCSLSRIWGGIHPPFDDIPGRLIGIEIGQRAYALAESYFLGVKTPPQVSETLVFPNPTSSVSQINLVYEGDLDVRIFATDGRLVRSLALNFQDNFSILDLTGLPAGLYALIGHSADGQRLLSEKIMVLSKP
jgi:hypothetical protein